LGVNELHPFLLNQTHSWVHEDAIFAGDVASVNNPGCGLNLALNALVNLSKLVLCLIE
jgi:hypothetical protein